MRTSFPAVRTTPAPPHARREWRARVVLLATATIMLAVGAAGQPTPGSIQPAPIARAAGYPGPLVVRPEGTGEISKAYGTPVWAASVTAVDKTFADVNVLLTDGGSFLTSAVRQRFDEAIAAPQRYVAAIRRDIVGRLARAGDAEDRSQAEHELRELDRLRAHSRFVEAVRLPNRRRGYSAILGFSRFDTTFATVLPSPDGRYELLVSVATPFEANAMPASAPSRRYRQRLRDHPLATVEAIALSIYRQLFPAPQ